MSESILLKCPKCGYQWKFRGKAKRAQCPNCDKFFSYQNQHKPAGNQQETSTMKNILNGSILKVMDQMDINPLKKKTVGDCIIVVLDDDNLVLALNKASGKKKRKPVTLVRKAVKLFLKQEGFL